MQPGERQRGFYYGLCIDSWKRGADLVPITADADGDNHAVRVDSAIGTNVACGYSCRTSAAVTDGGLRLE